MTKLEKAIKGLECCLANRHNKCLYKSTDEGIDRVTPCTTYLMQDALDLLKAQEPRVLTLEELIAIGQIWTSNTPPYLFMDIRRSCGYWCAWCDLSDMISGLHPKYTNDDYGIEWRCWTARPTDKQRKAVKWDG